SAPYGAVFTVSRSPQGGVRRSARRDRGDTASMATLARRRRRRTWLHLEALEDRTVPTLLGNQVFPADNPWNQRITNAPVAANSATLVASIGLTSAMHADFGAGTYAGSLIGIPFNVVPGTQAKVSVVLDAFASESDVAH